MASGFVPYMVEVWFLLYPCLACASAQQVRHRDMLCLHRYRPDHIIHDLQQLLA